MSSEEISDSQKYSFVCPECGGQRAETGAIRTTGDGLTRFLNMQNQKFTYINCSDCGFCKFFKGKPSGKLGNVLDILAG
jgi:predicted nucleic-acid-binding Zn-ribbon protein|tara:strand:+ start:1001 stop:1237 length:237 start_codon:yes stop_codon:yes gene_type:complete